MAAKTFTKLRLDDIERYTVTVRGKPYRLHTLDSLPVLASKRVSDYSNQLQALIALDKPTKAQERETEGLLEALCGEILDAPPAVHASLTGMQRLAVYQVFLRLPSESLRLIVQHQQGMPKETPTTPIGVSTSRASRGSTGATRTPGSRPSRRASSGAVSSI